MEVSDLNNVKIYNLSVGKSIPEWLSDRKRRALLKKDGRARHSLQLIQDFEMPGVSNSVRVSPDGQYILATGVYKPRIKCFETKNMSQKFERCFDAEATTFEILSEDYSKFILLQCDRFLEFHTAQGRLYRLRIPKYGRDLKVHTPSADLLISGVSSDLYRFNLEKGQFMTPFSSTATELTKIAVNPVHHVILCGTNDGKVEAWDHRSKTMVGSLDCAFHCSSENEQIGKIPSISAIKCDGALNMAVGTDTGKVLLYDLRLPKPSYIKDHMYGLPIKDVEFHYQDNLIFSMDEKIVKIWNRDTGKIFTSIESKTKYNNLCTVPNSGLFFMANESPKIQTYFIPSLGPAPKWAIYLDSLTEELEESTTQTIYDDFKFVSEQELIELKLTDLIGTSILKAHMHGYYMSIHLYKKIKALSMSCDFDSYRKKKIKEIIEKDRENRIHVNKLPQVNKEFALKLMSEATEEKKKKKNKQTNLLDDDRFKAMFENADFEINKDTDEYRLLNPVLSRLDKTREKKLKKQLAKEEDEEIEKVNDKFEDKASDESNSDFADSDEDDDSDDERVWVKDVKKQHRIINREHREKDRKEEEEKNAENKEQQSKIYELQHGEEYKGIQSLTKKKNKVALGERIKDEDNTHIKLLNSIGNREMSFSMNRNKRVKRLEEQNQKHRQERKKVVRTMRGLKLEPNRYLAHKPGGTRGRRFKR